MTQFSGGLYLYDVNGVLNDTIWQFGEGHHRLRCNSGYFKQRKTKEEREVFLGSYRYYSDLLDLSVELTYGRYYYQDEGVMVELQRHFGDTSKKPH